MQRLENVKKFIHFCFNWDSVLNLIAFFQLGVLVSIIFIVCYSVKLTIEQIKQIDNQIKIIDAREEQK